ncbi:3-phosphoshikimate 1-carboxyvinyltransferase [Enterococcus florum]|uniref:3-phosphoshikimate 1-carboxyvinyltransferase n=1 Tax=Enterococcus florum TaxID=2480627 RepID=A0A4V0WPF8_9ENTE|nr:3-phosphoshikimate 1-carboxyvinyltransferase [Enterococcus florum]GCF93709.1 3-phosphoshikimate 1-carboxyvinyltransferase [Enterococcus florum]
MRLLSKSKGLQGELTVPADKSISHRSIMFGAISHGTTTVYNFLKAEDCLSTIEVFKKLGVKIEEQDGVFHIEGKGFEGLQAPKEVLDVGNSGTTIRLVSGILAGRPFKTVLSGDASLNKRPMNRVMLPLIEMGAKASGHEGTEYPPITIEGGELSAISYQMPVASAQVKSALLFAALQADGESTILEKEHSRNHTEEMIRQFGGVISVEGKKITLKGNQQLTAQKVHVPGDISSAAFFLVAASLVPNSSVLLKHVGINPTRTGILEVLKAMGAKIELVDQDQTNQAADLKIDSAFLTSCEIGGEIIPRLIDELPILALAATQAQGTTVINDAEELKVKETNRIDATAKELNKMGAHIIPTEDGMIIHGPTPLHGAEVNSHGDHRIGMMLQVAALLTEEPVTLARPEAVNISYPAFFEDIKQLSKGE